MSHRNRIRSQIGAINKIDMTPLIDLTFLLLIVFMVTMPLLEYSTSVEPPDMNAEPMPEENTKTISVTAGGEIIFEGDRVSLEELTAKLTALKAFRKDAVVLVRGDGAANYGRIIEVMKAIKHGGFDNPRLVTAAED